jgi:hypothetical protein
MTINIDSTYTRRMDGDVLILTGYDPALQIGVGDNVFLPKRDQFIEYEMVEIERRDHKGEFINPENAINSFYEAKFKEKK